MSFKNFVKYFLILILLVVTVVILSKIRRKSGGNIIEKDITVGKELLYKVFNSSNKLALEIRCDSSKKNIDELQSEKSDRMNLYGIKGIIYKKGKISSNTNFSSTKGYVESNFSTLFLNGEVKIESKDLLLESDHILMEGNSLISTDCNVEYWLKDLDGISEKGLEYHIKIDVLNFFSTTGNFIKENKKYSYKTDKLIILGKLNKIVFKGNSLIQSAYSKLKGNEITLVFTDDFKKISRSVVTGDGYVLIKEIGDGNFKEARGGRIGVILAENGYLRSLDIKKNGILNIKRDRDKLKIEAGSIFVKFNPENDKISFVRNLRGSKINVSGKNRFIINSNRARIHYNKNGEVISCIAITNCEFKFKGISGTSGKIEYEPKNEIALISGKRAIVERSGSRFISSDFKIDLKNGKLFSDKEITSTINLNSSNPIFTGGSIFVKSKKIEIVEEKGKVKYSDNVKLIQDNTEITCDFLKIENKSFFNLDGHVIVSLKDSDNDVRLEGANLLMSDKNDRIEINGDAKFIYGDSSVSGENITVFFDSKKGIKKITGEKDIIFEKVDLKGKSDNISWDIIKNEIIFSGNAFIAREKSGETVGEIIRYFPENDRIVISAKKRKRSKTTIK